MWDDEQPQGHEPKEEFLMVDIITARREIGKFFYKIQVWGYFERRTAGQANEGIVILPVNPSAESYKSTASLSFPDSYDFDIAAPAKS